MSGFRDGDIVQMKDAPWLDGEWGRVTRADADVIDLLWFDADGKTIGPIVGLPACCVVRIASPTQNVIRRIAPRPLARTRAA